MSARILETMLRKSLDRGYGDQKSKESIDWFRKTARKSIVDPSRIMREEKDNLVNSWTNVGIGRMYFAYYDPKHKKTLPYYDTFPLMIPVQPRKDGFDALNLHYLPPVLRAKMLDSLYETLNNDRFDAKTKMALNYSMLKSLSGDSYFAPCYKRYLGAHFRSRFVKIPAENWTSAVFLPTETFQKASRKEVWAKSRSAI